jgi:hypothetical protein
MQLRWKLTDPNPPTPTEPSRLSDPPKGDWVPGFIQIYRVNRPLKLLYIDGMGAAKCDKGSMDTQDRLLLLNATIRWFDEWTRAKALCKVAEEWGLDGFIRMETGKF